MVVDPTGDDEDRIRVAVEGCPTRALALVLVDRTRARPRHAAHSRRSRTKGDPMPIALTDEHEAQRLSARRWLDAHCPPSVPRALLDADEETLQPVWKELAAQGWLGIHVPEAFGGQGFGLFELAVLLEETGWSVMPGALLPTVVTSAVVAEERGGAAADTAAALLPGLADGSRPAALVLR